MGKKRFHKDAKKGAYRGISELKSITKSAALMMAGMVAGLHADPDDMAPNKKVGAIKLPPLSEHHSDGRDFSRYWDDTEELSNPGKKFSQTHLDGKPLERVGAIKLPPINVDRSDDQDLSRYWDDTEELSNPSTKFSQRYLDGKPLERDGVTKYASSKKDGQGSSANGAPGRILPIKHFPLVRAGRNIVDHKGGDSYGISDNKSNSGMNLPPIHKTQDNSSVDDIQNRDDYATSPWLGGNKRDQKIPDINERKMDATLRYEEVIKRGSRNKSKSPLSNGAKSPGRRVSFKNESEERSFNKTDGAGEVHKTIYKVDTK